MKRLFVLSKENEEGNKDKQGEEATSTAASGEAETEKKTNDDVSMPEVVPFSFRSACAMQHMSAVSAERETRDSIVQDIGPNRRALCARSDLKIRRKLCMIDDVSVAIFQNQLLSLYDTRSSVVCGHIKTDRSFYQALDG